jgi:succinyl-CoA synthetase beta subunit
MARKKIREYAAKELLRRFLVKFNPKFDYSKYTCHLLTNNSNFRLFKQEHPELNDKRFVCKPDMLFGKRGSSGQPLHFRRPPAGPMYAPYI